MYNLSKTYFLTIFFNSYATHPLFLNIFSIFVFSMVLFLNRTTPCIVNPYGLNLKNCISTANLGC